MSIISYDLSPKVTAFSTTRRSPYVISPDELAEMGAYSAFNVTDYCGDVPERVKVARTFLCNHLGIAENHLWMPYQTHTNRVRIVNETAYGLGINERRAFLNETDALVTALPGVCVGVSTADCVPILLVDEESEVVAAVHAGWRGTLARIVARTIETMEKNFGTKPERLKALIGPSISADAYEVGDELVDLFMAEGFPKNIVRRPPSALNKTNLKPHLDLWAANVSLLEESGVNLERIAITGVCSYQHADTFFSARRLGVKSGRTFTGIMLKER